MKNNLDVNINAELKADLQPVIESTPNAINKLFELLFGIKHAKIRHTIELINAQKDKDKALINDGLVVFNIENKSLIRLEGDNKNNNENLITRKIQEDELVNIANCAKHTAKELMDVHLTSDTEISKDFFNRWREQAKLIDSHEAQFVWGKILAEEIKSPSSFSYRTLDVLKNLSSSEAKVFDKMCGFVVFGGSLLQGPHMTQDEQSLLNDAGLIVYTGTGLNAKWPETELNYKDSKKIKGYFLKTERFCIFTPKDDNHQEPTTSFLSLTKAGQEIYKIAKNAESIEPQAIADILFKNNNDLKSVIFYPYNNAERQEINMDAGQLIERKKITI
ncbi:DUF2806 domain-containing protein [Yersinia enterocolitica]|nr:DUF2806 domain-containing protein [Yersinia enterocolitica]